MIRLRCLLASVLIMSALAVAVSAQILTTPMEKGPPSMAERSRELKLPDTSQLPSSKSSKLDKGIIRQLEINALVEELKKENDNLSLAIKEPFENKRSKKKIGQSAERLAKLAYNLRKSSIGASERKKSTKPAATSDKKAEIDRFAESIDVLVKQVSEKKERLIYFSDDALSAEFSMNLEIIEKQALNIRELSR